jgi:chromosome segregation ATPase
MLRSFMLFPAAMLAIAGCEPASESTSTARVDDAKREVRQAEEKLKKARDDYAAALKADLDQADRDIDALKKKAETETGEMKDKMNKRINELEASRDETRRQYDGLKSDTGRAWDDVKSGMNKSWDALKNAIHNAKVEFK